MADRYLAITWQPDWQRALRAVALVLRKEKGSYPCPNWRVW